MRKDKSTSTEHNTIIHELHTHTQSHCRQINVYYAYFYSRTHHGQTDKHACIRIYSYTLHTEHQQYQQGGRKEREIERVCVIVLSHFHVLYLNTIKNFPAVLKR